MLASHPLRAGITLLLVPLLAACGQGAASPPATTSSAATVEQVATVAPAPTVALALADPTVAPAPTGVSPTLEPAVVPSEAEPAETPSPGAPTPTGAPAPAVGATPDGFPAAATATAGDDREPPQWQLSNRMSDVVGASARTATTMTLAWPPAVDNSGAVRYEIYGAALGDQPWNPQSGPARLSLLGSSSTESFIAEGLQEITIYAFMVQALDAAGNRSPALPPLILRTTDETPPTVPTGLRLVPEWTTNDILYLRWEPSSDNMQVVQYELLLDGVRFDSSYELEAQLFGVEPGKIFTITVVAIDLDGNRSAPSTLLLAGTHATAPPADVPHMSVVVTRRPDGALISWDAVADAIGPVSYAIYRDNLDNLVTVTDQTSVSLSGLTPDDRTFISIYTRNAAGQQSLSPALAVVEPFQP